MVKLSGKTLLKMDRWLYYQALLFCEKNLNKYQFLLLESMNCERLSQAERATLNDIVFGDIDGEEIPLEKFDIPAFSNMSMINSKLEELRARIGK